MKVLAAPVFLLALAASAASAGGAPRTVLAVVFAGGGQLARLDAATMAPRAVARVGFAPSTAVASSPTGAEIAIGSDEGRARVAIVDARTMTLRRTITVAAAGRVEAVAWPATRRIVAVTSGAGASPTLAVVEPVSRARVARRELGALVVATATRRALVAITAPRRSIGVARVVVADGNAIRSVALKVSAGWETSGSLRQRIPALAVEPGGLRVAVVPPDGRVVEVSLASLRVRYHAVERRLAVAAKTILGAWRSAVWTGRSLAVTGVDVVSGAGGRTRTHALGLELVDTRTWTARWVDTTTDSVAGADGAIVAWHSSPAQVSVSVYRPDGRLRFRRGERSGRSVAAAARYLYLGDAGATRFTIVDAHTGRVRARAAMRASTVVVTAR